MLTHVISPAVRRYLFLLSLLSALFLSSCGSSTGGSASSTPTPAPAPAIDAYGKAITFPKTAPQRIISLVPSTSEMLAALNVQDRVVGVDAFTDYPAEMLKKTKISDPSGNFNVEQIISLKPDLVVSSGGITKKYDDQFSQLGMHVVDMPSTNFTQALQQIDLLGRLTHTESTATNLRQQLQQQIDAIGAKVANTTSPKVLLEIDASTPGKPYVFGGGSFGDELLRLAHATNVFHDNASNGGYPQVTDEAILSANPQYVVLTEDPAYGGKPEDVYKRPNWTNLVALKEHHVYHLNTDIMQHPSQRLVQGLQCIAQIVHPDKLPGKLPDYCAASVA